MASFPIFWDEKIAGGCAEIDQSQGSREYHDQRWSENYDLNGCWWENCAATNCSCGTNLIVCGMGLCPKKVVQFVFEADGHMQMSQ